MSNIVSIDIETTGLHRKKDTITFIGAYRASDEAYLILEAPTKQSITELKTFCKGHKILAHNSPFDMSFIKAQFGITIPIHHDSMLLAHVIDSTQRKGLKVLAKKYLGVDDWDVSLKEKTSTDKKIVSPYLKKDVLYTYQLFEVLKKKVTKADIKLYTNLMIPAANAIVKIQTNGIYFNKKEALRLHDLLAQEISLLDSRLREFIPEGHGLEKMNLNSAKQLRKLLFDVFEFAPIKLTNKGDQSTDKEVINKLSKQTGHPFLLALLDLRTVERERQFITKWLELEYKSRLYPSFNLAGTKTGRLSSSEPNIQQVPRSKRLRNLFTAPRGSTFVEVDFSQVELRIIAHISQDSNMLDAYQKGSDLHTETARLFDGSGEITYESRTKAKAMNFGLVYGMQAKGFREYAGSGYGVEMTLAEAEATRTAFFTKYPRLINYHQQVTTKVNAQGKLFNAFGRRLNLVEGLSPNKWKRIAAARQGVNFPVQSMASDLLVSALIGLTKLEKHGVKVVATVHDSVLVEVAEETALKDLKFLMVAKNKLELACKIQDKIVGIDFLDNVYDVIQKTMEQPELLDIYGITLDVPLIADLDKGPWGS